MGQSVLLETGVRICSTIHYISALHADRIYVVSKDAQPEACVKCGDPISDSAISTPVLVAPSDDFLTPLKSVTNANCPHCGYNPQRQILLFDGAVSTP